MASINMSNSQVSTMLHHAARKLSERLAQIKHVVLVLSGKGGVGKSTCTVQIAAALVRKGFKVI